MNPRYQATWRSLIFNRVLDDSGLADDPAHLVAAYANSDYRLESLDLTTVQTMDYRELRQHLEGADPNQSFEGVRIIAGSGLILGADVADLDDKTWAMYESFSPAACRLAFAASDPKGVGAFDFKRATSGGTKALRLYAKPATGRPVIVGRMREGLSRRFQFQLVAPDPFAYDVSQSTATLTTAGGTVANGGNMYTYPVIEISATGAGASNFTITNTTTGQAVVIDLSDVSGSNPVRIADTRRSTMVRQDGTDRLYTLTSGFLTNMFLLPGNNVFSFANGTNISSIVFKWRGAYA